MLKIHIYGEIKKKFDKKASFSENTIIKVNSIKDETFYDLINRLKVQTDELGDCFINSKIARGDTIVPENARVALFSSGMFLLCGGQHLKGHGFVTSKNKSKQIEYF